MGLGSGIGHVRKALAAGIVAALGSHCAEAAVYNVTNTNDAGPGSLRDALAQANGNMEADTIDLSAISGQTIALTSGELQTYLDDITVNGAGVTIDAGGNSRVLYAYDSDVTINDLTITGGSDFAGGGILAKYGSLTLNDSVVTGNAAQRGGGVHASGYFGDVSINRSQITGNTALYAGGVYVVSFYDDITISDSVISGNSAEQGQLPPGGGPVAFGGAWLHAYRGDTVVTGSMIAANFSEGHTGGLAAYSSLGNVSIESSTISGNFAVSHRGGGIALAGYVLRLRNSTISGNTSNGVGGFEAHAGPFTGGNGVLTFEFVTVFNNTSSSSVGGLSLLSSGSLELVASTIAGNKGPVDSDLRLVGTTHGDVAFTLIGVDPSTGTLSKDAVSTALTGQNPLLSPLADNGGHTFTHLPAWNSPLIDAIPPGDSGCGTTVVLDQRGESRPTGTGCDIGALELTGTPPPVIPEARAVPVFDQLGLAIMAGLVSLLGWIGIRRRL